MNRTYDLTPPPGAPDPSETTLVPASEPATDKQLAYLRDLINGRMIEESARAELLTRVNDQADINAGKPEDPQREYPRVGLTKNRASNFIERLLKAPKRARGERPMMADASLPGPDVIPAGHYAVKQATSGELRFYHLWRGNRNPNYIKLYVEHGPDASEIPFKSHEFKAIINQIAEDPAAAARLYGRHIGACSECHKRLTNRISRLLDIGPVCGGHFYDEEIWKAMRTRARKALLDAGLDPDTDVEDTDDLDRIRELARL